MARMDAAAFVGALRVMTPAQIVVVADCVLWPDGDPPPSGAHVEDEVTRRRDNFASIGLPAAADRARASYEHDFNRRFLIRDLDVDSDSWTAADLVACAEHWAAVLRDALRRLAPDRAFVVEVVGADAADDEPLEVCVTFSQLVPPGSSAT
jgi:hypothetical protein